MSRVVMTTRLVILLFGVMVPMMSAFGQASFQGLGDLPRGEKCGLGAFLGETYPPPGFSAPSDSPSCP